MKNLQSALLGAALLFWDLFNRKGRFDSRTPEKIEHGVTVVRPEPKNSEWHKKRHARDYKRAVRRVLSRGTLRVKGHRFPVPVNNRGVGEPNKHWHAKQLAEVGLCKIRVKLPGGRRETMVAPLFFRQQAAPSF